MNKLEKNSLDIFNDRGGGINTRVIEKRMKLKKGKGSRVCQSLYKKGYLERVLQGIYKITDEGKKVIEDK